MTAAIIPGRLFFVAAALFLFPLGLAGAQHTEGVRLELRPSAGDTLDLRVEQRTELVGSVARATRDTALTMTTTMLMFARAIILRTSPNGADVVAVTDSIRVTTSGTDGAALEAAANAMKGKKVQMRVNPDGSSVLLDSESSVSAVIRAVLSDMPATLPKGLVRVGEVWTSTVPVNLDKSLGSLSVRTTFQLDSLSAGKEMAYISMRGVIVEELPRGETESQSGTTGDMRGNMALDRKRGWITNSLATITINAVIHQSAESRMPDMNFQIRITQQMRTLNSR